MPWTDSARRQYARTAERYATDLTDEEFALLAPHLPTPNRPGRPRTVDLREVLNAILHLLRTGCAWGAADAAPAPPGTDNRLCRSWGLLPKEFPPKSTVFGCFRRLWEDGTWPALHAALVMAARERAGREASPTAPILDSQSVRTTEAGGPKGYDAGKKIAGRKRHVLVDTLGLLRVIVVHTADIQDRDGVALVCRRLRRRFPWPRLIGACPRAGLRPDPGADGAYQGETAACAAAQEGLRLEIIRRDPGTRGFAVLPRHVQRAIAKDTVSRVGRKVKTDWAAWSKRSLAGEDVVRLILDGTVVRARLDRRATVALRPAVPTQRRTLHRHGNLLAHAPDHLHEEVAADDTDMIHAGTAEAVAARRTAFLREWRPECRAVADSLEEAGDELFTFPPAAEPVEVGADDECRRAPARGVQAAEQDPDRPAEPGDGGAAVLGAARLGADHDAQGRRLADARPTARRRRH